MIRVVLPQTAAASLIETGTSLTVFGAVQTLDGDEIILHCDDFKVNVDGGALSEIHHWLKAVADRPHNNVSSQRNMFYSVSSAPSPNRLLKENFMVSPLRDFAADDAKYLWSPNHVFATSTPLKLIREHAPPSAAAVAEAEEDEEDEEEDEFDTFGDDIDQAALEAAALQRHQQQANKRRYSLSMD